MQRRTAAGLAALSFFITFAFPKICDSQQGPEVPPKVPAIDLGILSERKEPIQITADRLDYLQETDTYTAEGQVVVTQGRLRLSSDRLVLENTTGRLTAEGHVELFEGEDLLRADRLEFDINTSQGVVYKGRIDTQKENYHIEGERMERLSEDVYLVDRGSLTTCDLCEGQSPAWRFRAKKLRLRLDRYAVAHGVTLDIKEVPVLYLPYLIFPVKTTRQSGFLFPRIGYSTKEEGFQYIQPFFWAINPSQDATLSLDYRSAKGVGGVLEYRYVLSRVSGGRLESLYFYDRDLKQERIDLRYRHNQQITQRLDFRADLNFLNRKDVRNELSNITSERTQSSVESNLFLQHRTQLHLFSVLARYSQNLIGSDNLTLQRLPEINYVLTEWPVTGLPFLVGGEFSAVNFWREDELEDPDPEKAKLRVVRLDLNPRLWWPLSLGGLGTLTPHAGIRETYYSRRVQSHEGFHREIPIFGVDFKSLWVHRYGAQSPEMQRAVVHLVEPILQYEFADLLQDEVVPQFDQVDLATDKNLITYGLTNRFRIENREGGVRGQEVLFFRVTHSFNLDRDERSLSDVRAEWQIRPGGWFFLDADVFYNVYDDRLSSINSDARIRWSPYLEVSGGQRFTREGVQVKRGDLLNPLSLGEKFNQPDRIEFLTAGARLYIPWVFGNLTQGLGLYLATQGYYNLRTDGFAEIGYALKYSAQCWEFVLDYRDFPEKNQISFLITLKGAVSVDSRFAGGLFEKEPAQ